MIGGRAPSEYLNKIQRSAGINEERMNEILASHIIDFYALRKDDFDAFLLAREHEILKRIEKSMGKHILVDNTQSVNDDNIPSNDNKTDIMGIEG